MTGRPHRSGSRCVPIFKNNLDYDGKIKTKLSKTII